MTTVCAVSHLVDLKETEDLKGKALVYLLLLSAKALLSTAVYMQKTILKLLKTLLMGFLPPNSIANSRHI